MIRSLLMFSVGCTALLTTTSHAKTVHDSKVRSETVDRTKLAGNRRLVEAVSLKADCVVSSDKSTTGTKGEEECVPH